MDAPGNDGNALMPEQVKRPNPWRKMMMMMLNSDVSTILKHINSLYIAIKIFLGSILLNSTA